MKINLSVTYTYFFKKFGVYNFHVCLCAMCIPCASGEWETMSDSLELELFIVACHHVCARTQIWVPWKNIRQPWFMNNVSIFELFFLVCLQYIIWIMALNYNKTQVLCNILSHVFWAEKTSSKLSYVLIHFLTHI